jgi:hypothetical protein
VHVAKAAQLPELAAMAHHGLMIAAVRASSFDDALFHGWEAFRDLHGHSHREAEMLLNLGQLLVDIGHPQTGLAAFAAALRRGPIPRLALHTLGGVALAAAALKDRELVQLVRRSAASMGTQEGLAYPYASTQLDIAEAFAHLGMPAEVGIILSDIASVLAKHEFHELRHRADILRESLIPPTSAPAKTAVMGDRGKSVVRHISEMEDITGLPSLVADTGRRIAVST